MSAREAECHIATWNVHVYAFDERAADEMESKGWTTIQVEMNDTWYFIEFFDLARLSQDLAQSTNGASPCSDDNNLVVVPQLTRASVTRSVWHLLETGYFERAWSEKVKPERYGYEFAVFNV